MLVRFTGYADATLAHGLKRTGTHSQAWHNRFFRDLVLTLVQMDELNTRICTTGNPALTCPMTARQTQKLAPQHRHAYAHALGSMSRVVCAFA